MTDRPTKAIADCATGIVSIVELTDEEMEQLEKDRVEYETRSAVIKAQQEEQEQIKASALAKLAALGLTEEEAKAIAG
jgi:hypothetical protein